MTTTKPREMKPPIDPPKGRHEGRPHPDRVALWGFRCARGGYPELEFTFSLHNHTVRKSIQNNVQPLGRFLRGPTVSSGGLAASAAPSRRGGAMNQSACGLGTAVVWPAAAVSGPRCGQAPQDFLRCTCAYVAHNVCELPRAGRSRLADDLLAPRAPARPTNVRNAGPARCHLSALARSGILVRR